VPYSIFMVIRKVVVLNFYGLAQIIEKRGLTDALV